MRRIFTASLLIAAGLAGARVSTQSADLFNEHLLQPFTYRNLGPFRMGARTSDIAVPDVAGQDHLYTFYVSFWTGGVWKTTNNGTTFEPVFDRAGQAVDRRRHRRAVECGHRLGRHGRRVHVAQFVRGRRRLQVHRRRQDVEEHGAERLAAHRADRRSIRRIPTSSTSPRWGISIRTTPSAACSRRPTAARRGRRSLFVSDRVGVIDLVMDPKNPTVLYAATYDKQRLPWQIVNGGPGSGHLQDDRRGRALDEARRRTAERPASGASASTST